MSSYYNHNNKSDNYSYTEDVAIKEDLTLQVVGLKIQQVSWQKIAEQTKISTRKAKQIWKEAKEQFGSLSDLNLDAHAIELLEEYKIMKRELWSEWHRSKEDVTINKTVNTETVSGGETYTTDSEHNTTKGRLGNVAIMSEIRQINNEISKLLGLISHVEMNITNNNQFNVMTSANNMIPDQYNAIIGKEVKPSVLSIEEMDKNTE